MKVNFYKLKEDLTIKTSFTRANLWRQCIDCFEDNLCPNFTQLLGETIVQDFLTLDLNFQMDELYLYALQN